MLKVLPACLAAMSLSPWYYNVALLLVCIRMVPFKIMVLNGQRIQANKNCAEAFLTDPKFEAGKFFPLDKSGLDRTISPVRQNALAATVGSICDKVVMAVACKRGPSRFSHIKHLLQRVKHSLESKVNVEKMTVASIDFIRLSLSSLKSLWVMPTSSLFFHTDTAPSHAHMRPMTVASCGLVSMHLLLPVAVAMMTMSATLGVARAQGTWATAQLSVGRQYFAATSVGNLAIFAGGFAYGAVLWRCRCCW